MEMKLAENIRRFRKERSLTQEQLAEVMGVTTGAVYKWEAGLSVPDLDLIVELADFFDTSVDVLLGYVKHDARMEETAQRLAGYRRRKDRAGLAEAERALRKYPYCFRIVYESACLYRAFGIETDAPEDHRRALELLERSLRLLPQNTDPEISEQTLYGKMADAQLGLKEWEKAVDLLKQHNAGAHYSSEIGKILAVSGRPEEAVPFLSEGLAKLIGNLANEIVGYLNVYSERGDLDSARSILELGIGFFSGLREEKKPNFFDKVNAAFLGALAAVQVRSGRTDEARASLEQARRLALFFDASPSYDESDVRFLTHIEGASVHDDLGTTAMESLENRIADFEDEALAALWESVKAQDEEKEGE